MSGNQTVSVQMLNGVVLEVNPKVAIVKRGTKVEFTATAAGVKVDQPAWRFVPRPGVTNETTGCADGSNPCTLTVNTDGALHVSKFLKGRMRSAEAGVMVYSDFSLVADETEINEGDIDGFTPLLDGAPASAARWEWRDDQGAVVPNPCSQIVGGKCWYTPARSGTMWAFTSSGNGAESAQAHVTVKGQGFYITFDSHDEMIRPSTYPFAVTSACATAPSSIPRRNRGLTVTEGTGPGGPPVRGKTVTLTLGVVAASGHHLAHAPDRPLGSFAGGTEQLTTLDVVTDEQGHAAFDYFAPEFSGTYWVQAEVDQSLASDEFRVGVALEPLAWSSQGAWLKYGKGRDKHSDVYNGLPQMNRYVLALADSFNTRYGKKLYYNDESLPTGGRFDVNGNWGADEDHCSHRWGNGLDVHTITNDDAPGLTDDEFKYVQRTWKKIIASKRVPLYHRQHFHLQIANSQ